MKKMCLWLVLLAGCGQPTAPVIVDDAVTFSIVPGAGADMRLLRWTGVVTNTTVKPVVDLDIRLLAANGELIGKHPTLYAIPAGTTQRLSGEIDIFADMSVKKVELVIVEEKK